MDFSVLLEDHGLHLQLVGVIFAMFGALLAFLRFMIKGIGNQIKETREDLRGVNSDVKTVNSDVKGVARDVIEIKTSMAQFVTRDEFTKGLERAHMRIDGLEQVILDRRARLPAKIPEKDDSDPK